MTYKKDMDFKNLYFYETGKVVVSTDITSSSNWRYRIFHE